jgi:hypothetical protein
MSTRRNKAAVLVPQKKRTSPRIIVLALIIILLPALFFAHLGHYSLWDDEAGTALPAKGVIRTGDTSAVVDHNIVAYRNGSELTNLKFRYLPPLQVYIAAPFLNVLGEQSAFAARLPFAIFGLLSVALVFWWLRKDRATPITQMLFAIGFLCSVPLILYSRQCRYYGAALFCSVAIVYVYLHWRGLRREFAAFIFLSLCLLSLNYINYIALYACLATDYLLWGRNRFRLTVPDWLILGIPQVAIGGLVFWIWNPLSKNVVQNTSSDWLADKITLFWWNLRDMNSCEFGAIFLLMLAPVLFPSSRDKWLLRAPLALITYVIATTIISPQPVNQTSVADIRYLVPLIPLGIALAVQMILVIAGTKTWLALGLALVMFGTNLLNGGPLLLRGARSTIVDYAGELLNPPAEPYRAAATWINENVRDRESIWVLPEYMVYPLMFHAPKATYAWQLAANNHDPQFAGLPSIHFQGRVPPDYIIAFGPVAQQVRQAIAGWQGVRYEQIATLDCYWRDLYRPELFWRTFKPVTGYNKQTEAIYVLKLQRN